MNFVFKARSQSQPIQQPYLPPQPINRMTSWVSNQGPNMDPMPEPERLSSQYGKHVTDVPPDSYSENRRENPDDFYRRTNRRENERGGDWNDRWGVRPRGDRGPFRMRDISPGNFDKD